MRLSIILPAYNEEKLLGETLQRVKAAAGALDHRGWRWELIVCDNNSSDRTSEVAREGGATVVFEPVNQIGRARNRGAAAAKGDWLLFIDADSHPSAELFIDTVDAIESRRVLAGGSTLRMEDCPWPGPWIAGFWNLVSRATRSLAGSYIFCDAEVFRNMGGFNQDLYASEELELSRRLRRQARRDGKRVVILHRHPLYTSARKIHLYSRTEYARFFLRTAFGFRRTLRSPEACHIWYDGRR